MMNMREEFEKWFKEKFAENVDFRLSGTQYRNPQVWMAYEVWQAAQPKWIKCSERTPGSEDIILRAENASVWVGGYDEEHKCFFEYSGECVFDFTHWMPLPNPPED